MRKMMALLMVGVLSVNMLAGCGAEGKAAKEEADAPVKVGVMPYLGSVPVDYAVQKNYFKDRGLNIEVYTFATGAPMNEAFAAGQIDVAVIGLAGVITMSTGTATCILETNTASGGNGVYVRADSDVAQVKGQVEGRPNILGSADTLKGKTFIGQLGTSSQLNVISYLKHFDLTEEDISFVNMDSGSDLQAFLAGEGDAVALAVPYSYQAEEKGLVCAADFEDSTSIMVPDVMLAKNELVEKRSDDVKKFVEAYLQAAEELNGDEELLYNTCKEFYKANGREYSDSNLKSDLACRKLIDKKYMENEGYTYGKGMWQVAQFFVKSGKIEESNQQNVLKSLNTSYIKDVTGLDVTVENGDSK